jgi:hypothetical protein
MTAATTPLFRAAIARHHELRSDWLDQIESLYLAAEAATRGHLLNRRGRDCGIDPRSLFYGSQIRASAYASDELIEHWQTHPRLPWRHYVAALDRESCPTCGQAIS